MYHKKRNRLSKRNGEWVEEEKRFGDGSIFVRKEFYANSRELDPQILDDSRSLPKEFESIFSSWNVWFGFEYSFFPPKKKVTNDAWLMMWTRKYSNKADIHWSKSCYKIVIHLFRKISITFSLQRQFFRGGFFFLFLFFYEKPIRNKYLKKCP